MKKFFVCALFSVWSSCGGANVITVPARFEGELVDPTRLISYELWVLDQLGRDNNPISCDALLSRQTSPLSPNVIPLKRDPFQGNFSEGASIRINDIPRGEGRAVFYIEVFDQPDQVGTRVAAGCLSGQTIVGGKTTKFEIEVDAPPTASVR
jgi:hypothetical protein